METKAVNVRMPMQLYEKIKEISDKEYISVSGLIFNILDRALTTNGDDHVYIREIEETDKLRIPAVMPGVLSENDG